MVLRPQKDTGMGSIPRDIRLGKGVKLVMLTASNASESALSAFNEGYKS